MTPAEPQHAAAPRRARRILIPVGLVVLLAIAATAAILLGRDSKPCAAGSAGCTNAGDTSVSGASPGLAVPGGKSPSPGVSINPSTVASAEPTGAPSRTQALAVNATGGGRYPARFSVGAPGVKRYAQSDASLPVPSGYKVVKPSNKDSKEWDLYDCNGTVNLNRMYFKAFIYIAENCHGTVNITNSIIAPPPGSNNRSILVNSNESGKLTLNVTNTTIRPEPVGLGKINEPLNTPAINDCAINLNRVDVANTGGMCLCGARTTIRHSWIHDNYIAHLPDPSVQHTGGVFPYGGSGPVVIENSRLEPGVNAATGKPVPGYWKAITAVLFTQSAGGSRLRNYSVRDSFISLGAYGFYPEDGVDMRLTGNVFGPTHWGAIGKCDGGCNVTFAEWSNNVVGSIDGVPTKKSVQKPS